MGFWDWVKSTAKKVGSAITGGARKVGSFLQEGAKAVGGVAGKVVDVAKKVAPFVQNIPVLGQAVGMIAKGDKVLDIVKDVGAGRFGSALEKGVGMVAPSIPVVGQAYNIGRSAYELGQRAGQMKNPSVGDIVGVGKEAYGLGRQLGGLYRP